MTRDLCQALDGLHAGYRILRQDRPILSAADAAGYYPLEKAAPAFVLQTERGLIGCIASAQNGRLDMEALKRRFGFEKLKLADRKKVARETGFEAGAIPLVGLGLPCIFDEKLLRHDLVYGGTGDALETLEIDPRDLLKANEIIGTFE